ncbi:MAG TPA: class I SAM-dependent methyltransferase, partial [Bacteroidota bacterium]|nr:class I SAM-dependent methyltransferase [Bacteroidota bacterium]
MTARCNICGNDGTFVRKEHPREGEICTNCSSSSRLRAIVYVIGAQFSLNDQPLVAWKPMKNVRILESSGRGPYPPMLKERFDYYNTEYNPNSELMRKPFTEYADFMNLAYDADTFDIVIASDVFEHVREDEKGFREIFRVLKPGGIFILTVPYHHEWPQTEIRVKIEGDKEIHLLPPEYHGGGGQTLAYRTYGRDLMTRLRSFGYSVGYLDLEAPAFQIG